MAHPFLTHLGVTAAILLVVLVLMGLTVILLVKHHSLYAVVLLGVTTIGFVTGLALSNARLGIATGGSASPSGSPGLPIPLLPTAFIVPKSIAGLPAMHRVAGQLPDFRDRAVLGSTIGAYGSAGRRFVVFAGSGPEPAHSGSQRFQALLRRADRETLDPSNAATGSQSSARIVCEPFIGSSGPDVICAWNDRSKDRFGVIVGVSATVRSALTFTQDAVRAMKA